MWGDVKTLEDLPLDHELAKLIEPNSPRLDGFLRATAVRSLDADKPRQHLTKADPIVADCFISIKRAKHLIIIARVYYIFKILSLGDLANALYGPDNLSPARLRDLAGVLNQQYGELDEKERTTIISKGKADTEEDQIELITRDLKKWLSRSKKIRLVLRKIWDWINILHVQLLRCRYLVSIFRFPSRYQAVSARL